MPDYSCRARRTDPMFRSMFLAAVLGMCHVVRAATFSDDFNRPDSSSVGNGWTDTTGNTNGNLAIVNNQLSATDQGGVAGIYRPFSFGAPVEVSSQLFEASGFTSDLLRRYDHTFLFANDGQLFHGYGVTFARGDQNYNDSRVNIFDSGSGGVIAEIFSTFQYGPSINVQFTVNPNGQINGSVTEGAQEFDFTFGPVTIQSAGPNFSAGMGFSSTGTQPRIDNLSLTIVPKPFAAITMTAGVALLASGRSRRICS